MKKCCECNELYDEDDWDFCPKCGGELRWATEEDENNFWENEDED